MVSGRCVDGWFGGVSGGTHGERFPLGMLGGGTLGAAVGIFNGDAVGGNLGAVVGGILGDAMGGTLGSAVGITLGYWAVVGALVGTTIGTVADLGNSVGGSLEWWGLNSSVGTKGGS